VEDERQVKVGMCTLQSSATLFLKIVLRLIKKEIPILDIQYIGKKYIFIKHINIQIYKYTNIQIYKYTKEYEERNRNKCTFVYDREYIIQKRKEEKANLFSA
jgi:hypothetical protein